MVYGVLLGVLTLAAGVIFRSRVSRVIGRSDRVVTDELVRQIEESGRIEVDEPLDLDQIQEEEARFWEEPWDEADEW